MKGNADRRADDFEFVEANALKLRADVNVRGDGCEECTIYPADPIDGKFTTVWITAAGDSFVPLGEMR